MDVRFPTFFPTDPLSQWYGVVGLMCLVYYWPWQESYRVPVRLRPVWIPARILLAIHLSTPVLWVLLVCATASLMYYPDLHSWWVARFFFACLVSGLDVDAYSALNAHNAFIMLYSSWAMVLPWPNLQILVVRLVLIHQMLSSGLSKLRVGGRKWLEAETVATYLSASGYPMRPRPWARPNKFLYSPELVAWVLQHKNTIGPLLAIGIIALQVVIVPICIAWGSPTTDAYAFYFMLVFVLGIAIFFGLNFSFHIAAFYLILVLGHGANGEGTDQKYLITENFLGIEIVVFLLVVSVLAYASVKHIESWPLNAQGLYSYNYEQLNRLLSMQHIFILGHTDSEENKESSDQTITHHVEQSGMGQLHMPLLFDRITNRVVSEKTSIIGKNLDTHTLMRKRCLLAACASGIPIASIYHHKFVELVGGVCFGIGRVDPARRDIFFNLLDWVQKEKPFLDGFRGFKPYDTITMKKIKDKSDNVQD